MANGMAKLIFEVGQRDPEHKLNANKIASKIAEGRSQIGKISGKQSGLDLKKISSGEEKEWLGHVNGIVKKLKISANPKSGGKLAIGDISGGKGGLSIGNISQGVKAEAAQLFKRHYEKDIADAVKRLGNIGKR